MNTLDQADEHSFQCQKMMTGMDRKTVIFMGKEGRFRTLGFLLVDF